MPRRMTVSVLATFAVYLAASTEPTNAAPSGPDCGYANECGEIGFPAPALFLGSWEGMLLFSHERDVEWATAVAREDHRESGHEWVEGWDHGNDGDDIWE